MKEHDVQALAINDNTRFPFKALVIIDTPKFLSYGNG